jgi:hypothetical protein
MLSSGDSQESCFFVRDSLLLQVKPYPQRFLLMVIATKMGPVTDLWESAA